MANVIHYSRAQEANTGGDRPTYDVWRVLANNIEAMRWTGATSILAAVEADVGLTAAAGSSQGDGVILSSYNVYSTVATTGDAATLPATFGAGTLVYVKNDGANSMDVFPASGDNAGAGTNTAVAVDAGKSAAFFATTANSVWTNLIVGGTGGSSVATDLFRISVQSAGLTIATTAYVAGDQVGTQFEFANAASSSGGYGYVTGATLISAADIIGAYDLVLTRSSITLAADNAAYAISDADALAIIGVVQLSGAYDIGNNRIAQSQNIRIPFDCSATSLYGGLICRAGHAFFAAVTDLQVILHVERI